MKNYSNFEKAMIKIAILISFPCAFVFIQMLDLNFWIRVVLVWPILTAFYILTFLKKKFL